MEAAILSALSRDQNETWLIKNIRVNIFLLIHYIYIILNKRDTNHPFNSSHGLQQVLFDIFVKISCDFQLTERTLVPGLNGYLQYLLRSKGNNSKGRQTRLKVLVLCTSSHKLPLCEVS